MRRINRRIDSCHSSDSYVMCTHSRFRRLFLLELCDCSSSSDSNTSFMDNGRNLSFYFGKMRLTISMQMSISRMNFNWRFELFFSSHSVLKTLNYDFGTGNIANEGTRRARITTRNEEKSTIFNTNYTRRERVKKVSNKKRTKCITSALKHREMIYV